MLTSACVIIILCLVLLFVVGLCVKYRMHAMAREAERNVAYFVLAESMGEGQAATEIATVNLETQGLGEQEILENRMLESKTDEVCEEIKKATQKYRRY